MKNFEFHPFDKVLVRSGNEAKWVLQWYSHKDGKDYVTMDGSFNLQCIPYDGNEDLYDTSDPYIEPYEPKDGDFVKDVDDSIFIYKESSTANHADCYVGYSEDEDDLFYDAESYTNKDTLKLASEEEKQWLIYNLHKFCKDWDAEKKVVVDWECNPSKDEKYYYPDYEIKKGIFQVCEVLWGLNQAPFENILYGSGRVFRTKEECQAMCDKLNEAINNVE